MKPTKTSITIDGITFTGILTPAEPMTMYARNGDPGEPGCPAEFEIESIEGDCMKLVELLNNQNHGLEDADLWVLLSDLCLEKLNDE